MPPARVLWVAAPNHRPDDVRSVWLRTANTQAAALETIESLAEEGEKADAIVAAPALPDGDGSAVLRAARDRWPDVACFLHGNLWAIPEGSSLPVCEFHPTGQTPSAVADAVADAVRGRYHRPYPVSDDEDRRLETVEATDFAAARADLEALTAETESETGADTAVVSVVDDHTVRLAAGGDDAGRRMLRRGDSPCTYAIEEPGETVIEDVSADERLAHVEQDCYRAYAARPLSVDGVPVGTLALLRDDAGAFTDLQLDGLARYADEAERILADAR